MTNSLRLTEESLRVAVVADALRGVARELLHEGDPALTWATWVYANLGDIKAAAYALGVEEGRERGIVEEGPGYVTRLRAAVLAKLAEARPGGSR